jgi:hypothetical protein
LGNNTCYPISLNDEIINCLLKNREVSLVFQNMADGCLVTNPVSLSSCGSHGWAFSCIKHSKLYAAKVCSSCHGTTEGINFFNQVTFTYASNSGVARHLAQCFDIVSQQQSTAAHTSSSKASLSSSMAAADNNNVKMIRV